MTGIRNFILGFGLSLFSVALGGQLYFSAPTTQKKLSTQVVKINLFKNATARQIPLFEPLPEKTNTVAESKGGDIRAVSPLVSYEGEEDDEILSVNVDDIVPIEFSASDSPEQAEVLYFADEDMSAMLPVDASQYGDDITPSSPWVVAKGNKHIKNKMLLEQFDADDLPSLQSDTFLQALNEDKQSSYKVAEKIKQSIIFPIPDEILNDENLTPTFASSAKKTQNPNAPKSTSATAKRSVSKTEDNLKIISKKQPEGESDSGSSKGIMDSISSWFSDKHSTTPASRPSQKKNAPTYSSQDTTTTNSAFSPSENLADFYESLQETKEEHTKKIVPSELKLFFRSGRAEISGSTLQWLKKFSEATNDNGTIVQIRLDASASAELQKKRLTLLYTIFVNNNANFDKIDTIFTLTEPDAFVIRIIRLN